MKHENPYGNTPASTVYLLDCIEGMKQYPDNHFDLSVVDPEYGGNDAIGLSNNNNFSKQATKRTEYKVFKNIAPEVKYFEELKRVSKNQIIWGVNFYKNYDLSGGRLVWDKKGTAFGRAELAYLSMTKSVNIVEIIWNGMIQHDMKDKEARIHVTQKPVKLYDWIFANYAKDCKTILDTHLGSQSSRIAAHKAGLNFTGFEIDPEYFEQGNKRFEQYASQTKLF
jgi:site-specific DNA-methyltransferase (adenine-specific)